MRFQFFVSIYCIVLNGHHHATKAIVHARMIHVDVIPAKAARRREPALSIGNVWPLIQQE
jgi:hypothetical protein